MAISLWCPAFAGEAGHRAVGAGKKLGPVEELMLAGILAAFANRTSECPAGSSRTHTSVPRDYKIGRLFGRAVLS
jgi:hypothetical protein